MNADQKKVYTSICAIFIRIIEMKTKTKMFYLTILLFVFVVRYLLFCALYVFLRNILPPHSNEDQANKKKVDSLLLFIGIRSNFYKGKPNINGGTLITVGGSVPPTI